MNYQEDKVHDHVYIGKPSLCGICYQPRPETGEIEAWADFHAANMGVEVVGVEGYYTTHQTPREKASIDAWNERVTREVAAVEGYYTTKDSGKRTVFDSGMQRDTSDDKLKWHLVTSGPMFKRWAELMTRGAEKYDDNNWMKADGEEEYLRFKESAMRHFMQWYYGDDDEDHAAAVFFNINGAEYVKDKNNA